MRVLRGELRRWVVDADAGVGRCGACLEGELAIN